MKISVIKTKKFILRPFQKGDENSLAKNINDRVIHRNTLSIPFPYTLKDAEDWIKKNLSEAKKKNPTELNFVIEISGEVIGSVGFSQIKGHKAAMGYWLNKKYRKRGIMTEVVKRIVKFGFGKLKLKRIYANVFSWNKASMRILKKTGFKFEGILRKNVKKGNKFLDDYLFAKIK